MRFVFIKDYLINLCDVRKLHYVDNEGRVYITYNTGVIDSITMSRTEFINFVSEIL